MICSGDLGFYEKRSLPPISVTNRRSRRTEIEKISNFRNLFCTVAMQSHLVPSSFWSALSSSPNRFIECNLMWSWWTHRNAVSSGPPDKNHWISPSVAEFHKKIIFFTEKSLDKDYHWPKVTNIVDICRIYFSIILNPLEPKDFRTVTRYSFLF